MKNILQEIISHATGEADAVFEVPTRPEFGHYSTSIALQLGKAQKRPPMEVAEELAEKARSAGPKNFFEKIEVAPPGFVNFWIQPGALQKELARILKLKVYGKPRILGKQKIQVEFISANPTGPLTLANGRGGFYGDALSNILEFCGARVEREFYVNDDGNQILTLGKSILSAAGYMAPEEHFYKGEYIKDWAAKNKAKVKKYSDKPMEVGYAAAADFLKATRVVIEKKSKIVFNRFTSERNDVRMKKLHEKALKIFQDNKLTYEKDGAVWLETTKFGDDKDRVLITRDGFPTYFLGDAGHYLETKLRGFTGKINILGPDHYGYVARIQAAAGLVGVKKSEVLVTQAVRLVRAGEEVKMSKRKGEFITFDELVGDVGADAARFFFLMISLDAHMDFDLALAKEKSNKNPVYYVQYAHARASNILKKIKKKNAGEKLNLKSLNTEEDSTLIRCLAQFPDVVEQTARDYQVHRVARYALTLSRAFHNFYEKERILEDGKVHAARVALVTATRKILKQTLGLLGVSAPDTM